MDGMSAERDRNAPADVPPAAAAVRGEMETDDDDDDDCCEGAAATGRGETAFSPRWEERFLAALIRTFTVDGIVCYLVDTITFRCDLKFRFQ